MALALLPPQLTWRRPVDGAAAGGLDAAVTELMAAESLPWARPGEDLTDPVLYAWSVLYAAQAEATAWRGGAVKRERATALLEEMLRCLDAGGGWPLELVEALYVFGSYARGALAPHDVDVAVDFRRDERMNQHLVSCLFSGRNPYSELRQALVGRRRGIQFQFETSERQQLEAEGVQMLRVWHRGDTLQQALEVLHGIKEDPDAGRAARDDMIEEFEGLDRAIPRPVRQELITWRDAGRLTITRLALPDSPAEPAAREMAWAIEGRWVAHSPLRRAALAALEYLQHRGVDLSEVDLAGDRLPTPARMAGTLLEPRWWVNWKWRCYQSIPYALADGDGWLEVLAPTRTRPLHALMFTPGTMPRAER
ncbi:nucleotidyltransferase domain-containing protein [Streptomyces sp. 8N706]|uniref:nucleotidyltransferase domain-containing protein n=1 Tax=Streptomyces sp. 8N706 TaxID=3457416 RepID=UPI003FD0FA23